MKFTAHADGTITIRAESDRDTSVLESALFHNLDHWRSAEKRERDARAKGKGPDDEHFAITREIVADREAEFDACLATASKARMRRDKRAGKR